MKLAIYPGSFDPITNGHIDIAQRALKIFDKLIILISDNPEKKALFSVQERTEMIQESLKGMKNVVVEHYHGLVVDYAKKKEAKAIIRGLRAVSDFESELQLALMNRKLCPDIETVFIMTRGMYCYLSASIVKQAAAFHAPLKGMVPEIVERKLKAKFS